MARLKLHLHEMNSERWIKSFDKLMRDVQSTAIILLLACILSLLMINFHKKEPTEVSEDSKSDAEYIVKSIPSGQDNNLVQITYDDLYLPDLYGWLTSDSSEVLQLIPDTDYTDEESSSSEDTETHEVVQSKVSEPEESEPELTTELEVVSEPEIKQDEWYCIGNFKITHYCNCVKCCGKWSGGPTKSGVMPVSGRTIAVDSDVIPMGSEIMINGHIYIAEDTGSGIQGNSIDIYCDDHQEALNKGMYYTDVYGRS